MIKRSIKRLLGRLGYRLVPLDPLFNGGRAFELADRTLDWLRHQQDMLKHPAGMLTASEMGSVPAISGGLFFRSSLCTAADFRHPEFKRWLTLLGEAPRLHRKIWEHVFIAAHVEAAGLLAPGNRGLGFGVGLEPLPSAFAKHGAAVLATDADVELAVNAGWAATGQHSKTAAELFQEKICDRESFDRFVEYETCDMNHISTHLRDFDFCWSSCSLEHLGSLAAGEAFIKNSLATLRPGGIAVHTTEYNISSNEETIDNNPSLNIFRRKDIEGIVSRLAKDGHSVAPVCFDVLSEPVDFFVDIPPYKSDAHLRLALGPFVCTSIGLVIQKSRS